ncbi:hypothetical protein CRG98_050449 [Punica granatum]|uniref:Uncharacterized protein n=1 Tax=Punica granatum TaxID=22663 RepID=A0A2I0GC88_PUNGR|nr:hypothetical protein CRG98_050449 [Punica granatum]
MGPIIQGELPGPFDFNLAPDMGSSSAEPTPALPGTRPAQRPFAEPSRMFLSAPLATSAALFDPVSTRPTLAQPVSSVEPVHSSSSDLLHFCPIRQRLHLLPTHNLILFLWYQSWLCFCALVWAHTTPNSVLRWPRMHLMLIRPESGPVQFRDN